MFLILFDLYAFKHFNKKVNTHTHTHICVCFTLDSIELGHRNQI